MTEKTPISETMSMSASLTTGNEGLIGAIGAVAAICTALAIILCLIMSVRRTVRNHNAARRTRQREWFSDFITETLNSGEDRPSHMYDRPRCGIGDMAHVLLHTFRTVRGEANERLQDLVSRSDLETLLARAARAGIRGRRMEALNVLSYLHSDRSAQIIYENLYSSDKYVCLTAARCLVRRGALVFLRAIIDACAQSFPHDHQRLASLISGFGLRAVPALESVAETGDTALVRAAALEALAHIMPAKLSLNLPALMNDPDENVRAAAVSLSAISSKSEGDDPLLMGLEDRAVKVKIRAAKLAHDLKRSDAVSALYSLTQDPAMWVRYWAFKAIWQTGRNGRDFVRALTDNNPMAANVTLEMESGYV